jgi:hypothetical protein
MTNTLYILRCDLVSVYASIGGSFGSNRAKSTAKMDILRNAGAKLPYMTRGGLEGFIECKLLY